MHTGLERVSYFLFETGERYRAIGQLARGEFPFALTQQQIAAATGLTAIHVNRMLRELRLAGVIDIRTSVARVLDHDALRKHASFNAAGLAPPEQSEVSLR